MKKRVSCLLLALCLALTLAPAAAARDYAPLTGLRWEGPVVRWNAAEGASQYYAGLLKLTENKPVLVKSVKTAETFASFENELYAYRNDVNTIFLVGVCILKNGSYDESPVYYTEQVPALYLAQGYRTPVPLTGEASIDVPYPGLRLQPRFSGELYQAWRKSADSLRYNWQISDSAGSGFASIYGENERTHVVEDSEIGKYLRVIVTAEGYTGQIVSNAVRVEKGFALPAENPSLTVGSNSRTGKPILVVTNARAHQEYFVTTQSMSTVPDGSWRDAVSPGSDGALSLDCTPGAVNYVYTRSKETASREAGEPLFGCAFVPEASAAAEVSALRLEVTNRERFGSSSAAYMVDDILEITVSALPENAAFDGIRGDSWYWEFNTVNEAGNPAFYADPGCKQALAADTCYRKVYLRLLSPGSGKHLNVERRTAGGDLLTASLRIQVADEHGQYEIDSVTLPAGITISAGEKGECSLLSWEPQEAELRNLGFDSDQSGAPFVEYDEESKTIRLDATKAMRGTSKYTALIGRVEMDDMIVTVTPKAADAGVESQISAPSILPLTPGQRAYAGVTVYPESRSGELAWSVDKPDVISVKDGYITADPNAPYGATATVSLRLAGVTAGISVIIIREEGELGVGDGGDTPTPVPVSGPSSWAVDEVTAAVGAKLVPDDLQSAYQSNITREEFCRLMVRLVSEALGQDVTQIAVSTGSLNYGTFSDTRSADVLTAYELGIVNGVGDGKFDPNGSITREQAATMLARTAKGLDLTSGSAIRFADAGSFSSWATEGIAYVSGMTDPVSGKAVMGGTGDNRFSPAASYTREQAILTALRLFHCR